MPSHSGASQVVKILPAHAGDVRDMDLIPGSGRSPAGGCGNPLQYSCLENSHEQRSLAGPSPWGHRQLDMTERLSTAYFEMIPLLNQLLVAPLVLAQLLQT